MFIIIGVLFLAVGIGVTVCTLRGFIIGNALMLFEEDKFETEFQFEVRFSYVFVVVPMSYFYFGIM
jgi:uncharacterized membrane protein YczE